MTNFNERFEPILNRVCSFLGNGWRIDRRLEPDAYRIRLMNPALKNYSIMIRLDKDRLRLTGGAINGNRYYQNSTCTVSPTRQPWEIAQDIKRKILVDAEKQIEFVAADQAGVKQQNEERRLVVNLLARIVDTHDYKGYYGTLCQIKAQGVSGDVFEAYRDTYKLNLQNLTKDQLIRVVGFLSTLER